MGEFDEEEEEEEEEDDDDEEEGDDDDDARARLGAASPHLLGEGEQPLVDHRLAVAPPE